MYDDLHLPTYTYTCITKWIFKPMKGDYFIYLCKNKFHDVFKSSFENVTIMSNIKICSKVIAFKKVNVLFKLFSHAYVAKILTQLSGNHIWHVG